jgi:hypothetical protein
VLPGTAGDPKVVPGGIDDPEIRRPGGIDDPEIRQAPRALLEILLQWPPGRHDPVAFICDIAYLKHQFQARN